MVCSAPLGIEAGPQSSGVAHRSLLFSGWPQVCKQAWNKKITCLKGKVYVQLGVNRVGG